MVEWLAGNRIIGTTAERTTIVNLSKSWEFADGKATSSFQMLPTGTSAFTLMMWVKFKDFSSNHEILRSDGGDIEMWTSTSGLYWAGSSSSTQLETAGNLSTSEWTHIAIARDGSGTDYLYVNGAVASATASVSSKTVPSQTTWYIGGRSNDAEDFDGDISQFLIYTDRKSTTEIQTVYNSGNGTLSPSTTNLQTHYNFAQTGSTLTDQEGSNNCTASGTIVKDKVGFPDGSINLVKSLQSPSVGGWVEVGRTTLGSAGDALTVSSFADKRYYMVLYNAIPSGDLTEYMTMGSNGTKDTGSNYSNRVSQEGGSDGTYTSRSNIVFASKSGATQPEFGVSYIANKSDKEKLLIGHSSNAVTAGAGTAPDRSEFVAKHSQTSNPLDVVSFDNTGSGDFDSGSECVVLGWDPADTHTTNFWEELASVELGSASDTLSSGTITAKKYLWVQTYIKAVSGTAEPDMRFNNDSGGNYADRYSINGGSDATGTSVTSVRGSGVPVSAFINDFIINNASNEKLVIRHVTYVSTAGAGTAPNRRETVGKWANTSDSITSIDWVENSGGAGQFDTGSFIKVWGSD